MNKHSFFSVIIIALLVPFVHAMEKEGLISPDSLNETGKSFIQKVIDRYVEAAEENGITQGMARVFKDIKKAGIDDLIQDQEVLKNTSKTYDQLLMNNITEDCTELLQAFYGGKNMRIYILRQSAQEGDDLEMATYQMRSVLLAMGYFEQIRQIKLNQPDANNPTGYFEQIRQIELNQLDANNS